MKVHKDPNVSIILPGCGAKCDFCFGKHDRPPVQGWAPKLMKGLAALPEEFWQISITGGEPMTSPLLPLALGAIDRDRWTKVVLTTNGTYIDPNAVDAMKGIVDHVNISRHSITYSINKRIFGLKSMAQDLDVSQFIRDLNRAGIDVTFNCVLDASLQWETQGEAWIRSYIAIASAMGASAVCFRKKQLEGGNLDPTEQENMFDLWAPIAESSCRVCCSKTQLIDGMRVVWKASVYDPGAYLKNEIYELIWQPSGEFTLDWDGNISMMQLLLQSGALKLPIDVDFTKETKVKDGYNPPPKNAPGPPMPPPSGPPPLTDRRDSNKKDNCEHGPSSKC